MKTQDSFITPREKDFAQWYQDVVEASDMAEHAPVKGCMVIKPYGYALWENIQKILNERIQATGASNAYFPLFIPESFIMKEKEHIQGFSPELAIVTHAGGEELKERLVVRPTSETIINAMFAKWIQSWRDLPLLINQWANVVRWEMRPRLFLRTTEFLWQEGHTAHKTKEEADRKAREMLQLYEDFCVQELAIPVFTGVKTESEKFAGAMISYTIEGVMQDGKALQMGTSHNLGQNFASAFDIQFTDETGQKQYVWQTSWGVSTRLIGGIIMAHGDDKGIILPPRVAPIQVIIIPIFKNLSARKATATYIQKLQVSLSSVRWKIDERDFLTVGEKFYEWEKKGVPLRMEIGPKDIEQEQITLVRRDTREKVSIPVKHVAHELKQYLEDIQADLYTKAFEFRAKHTFSVQTWEEFLHIIEHKQGFISTRWCGKRVCEERIKEQTKATARCIPFQDENDLSSCVVCSKKAAHRVFFAKAY